MKTYIQFSLITTLFCSGVWAQKSDVAWVTNDTIKTEVNDTVKKRKRILEEVKVSSTSKKQTILRSGIKPMDMPQSIQVVGSEIIEQQQSIRLSEVVKNANGVYVGSARGGAQESFWSRGYDMTANNMFKNGFRYNGGSIPEVSSLDKVEFLKGSSALLFGNVAPGGILNMVTKAPLFVSGGEISMQAGSYSFYKPSIDFYGPLSNSIAYRFISSYENAESFRDVVKSERFYINPSFLFIINKKTDLLLQGDYLNNNWTPDFGTGSIGKNILNIHRSEYLGAIWSTGLTNTSSVNAQLKHNFNDNWKLNFNSSFQNYSRYSKGTERIVPATNGSWNRPLGENNNLEKIFGNQFSINGKFDTGKIKHQFFTGLDFENSNADAYTFVFNPTTYGTGNIFDFDNFNQGGTIPNSTNTRIVKTETNRFGVFAQDLISFTEKIKVLAGLRWSWQEAKADTYDLTKNPVVITEGKKRKDEAFSPKIGLVYQPNKTISIFGSYANSFTPNTGNTINGDAIKPSIIDQVEFGIKKEFFGNKLTTNITVYQITNSNVAQTAAFKADGITPNADTNIKELNGGTKGKGIEIDITAKPIDGLNISAGYSYNDTRITKTSGTNGSLIEGDVLTRTPQNTANLSFNYKLQEGFFRGFSIGAIGNYIGNRLGGWNDRYVWTAVRPATTPPTYNVTIEDRDIPLTGYSTIDVSAGYEWKNISILCKVSNVTNELNYTVHENYSMNPIAPRQILTSLKYKF